MNSNMFQYYRYTDASPAQTHSLGTKSYLLSIKYPPSAPQAQLHSRKFHQNTVSCLHSCITQHILKGQQILLKRLFLQPILFFSHLTSFISINTEQSSIYMCTEGSIPQHQRCIQQSPGNKLLPILFPFPFSFSNGNNMMRFHMFSILLTKLLEEVDEQDFQQGMQI